MYPAQSAASFIEDLIVMDVCALEGGPKRPGGIAVDLAFRQMICWATVLTDSASNWEICILRKRGCPCLRPSKSLCKRQNVRV